MARKRYKTKRMDYRKGGRVQYAVGGKGPKEIKGNKSKPKPGDYGSKDEYQIALQQYRDSKPTTTAPAVTPPPARAGAPVTRPAGKAASTVDAITKEVEAKKSGTSSSQTPAPVVNTRVTSEEPDLSSGTDGAVASFGDTPAYGGPTGGQGSSAGTGNADNIVAVAKSTAATNAANTAAAEKAAATAKDKITLAKEATAKAGVIPDAKKVDETIVDTATTIDEGTKAVAGVAGPVTIDPTVTGTSTTAETQAPITVATVDPTLIGEGAKVEAVTGTVSDEALAEAAQVEDTPLIEGADVEIKEGALAERVVGTVSPEAMAIAAQAAGTTLSRVTRAKKQLRNAGISEAAIEELGNDPEALEDRLMSLTEAERGMIGDLPEEALVSNQLDSLLKGMENGEIPTWAGPAVSAVEQMLAQRGLSASISLD